MFIIPQKMGNSSKRRKSLGLDRVYFELKFPHTSIVLLDAGKLLEQTEALDSISISTGYRLSGKYADLKQITWQWERQKWERRRTMLLGQYGATDSQNKNPGEMWMMNGILQLSAFLVYT